MAAGEIRPSLGGGTGASCPGALRCLPKHVTARAFLLPKCSQWALVGQQTASPRVSIGAALVAAALGWVLRTRCMSGNPSTLCPQRRDAAHLGTTLGPEVAPRRSRAPDLVSCRTVAMAAGGMRSVLPALPGSLRTFGGIMAASPACPAPSSTASRSPTARQRPTRSVGNACRGEWGQILAQAEP